MNRFTEEVISILQSVPAGKVVTYGLLAGLAGKPGAARRIAKILRIYSSQYNLPWHRVVNSKGKISLSGDGYKIQKSLLLKEGIEFDEHDKIDFEIYLWDPLLE